MNHQTNRRKPNQEDYSRIQFAPYANVDMATFNSHYIYPSAQVYALKTATVICFSSYDDSF